MSVKANATITLIRVNDGAQGPQGVQGVKGADGKTYYTWIKYADSPTSGMSDNPSGKKYMGVAYNKSTATESSNYSDYTWSLIKGDKGDKGDKGSTGATGPQGPQGNKGDTGAQVLKVLLVRQATALNQLSTLMHAQLVKRHLAHRR